MEEVPVGTVYGQNQLTHNGQNLMVITTDYTIVRAHLGRKIELLDGKMSNVS